METVELLLEFCRDTAIAVLELVEEFCRDTAKPVLELTTEFCLDTAGGFRLPEEFCLERGTVSAAPPPVG